MKADPALYRELSRLGDETARALRSRAASAAARRAWVAASRWSWVAAGLAVALASAARLLAAPFMPGFAALAAIALAPPALAAIAAALAAFCAPVDARDGLALLDRELRESGRLQAGHEFAAIASPGAFERAAIADSKPALERARTHRLHPIAREPLPARAVLAPIAALAACFLAVAIAPSRDAGVPLPRDVASAPAPTPAAADAVRPPPPGPSAAPKAPERPPQPAVQGTRAADGEEPDRTATDGAGRTGEGASAHASPARAPSTSRGFSSTQTPPSESGDPGKQKPSPAQAKPTAREDSAGRKKLEESGSTAGKGTGAGSSRNPGSTEWQSKDQVTADAEEPLAADEPVDDESDESEARGGLQPSLRDRRPAVNRDLQIGFGNQPNPDANGRGGASEQKKSRGVASLVLGVPIPDHVKGQPNPGRTKITQERVEPQAESAARIDAAPRPARALPSGPPLRSAAPDSPWLSALVRAYFLSLHAPRPTHTDGRETPP